MQWPDDDEAGADASPRSARLPSFPFLSLTCFSCGGGYSARTRSTIGSLVAASAGRWLMARARGRDETRGEERGERRGETEVADESWESVGEGSGGWQREVGRADSQPLRQPVRQPASQSVSWPAALLASTRCRQLTEPPRLKGAAAAAAATCVVGCRWRMNTNSLNMQCGGEESELEEHSLALCGCDRNTGRSRSRDRGSSSSSSAFINTSALAAPYLLCVWERIKPDRCTLRECMRMTADAAL